MNMKRLKRRKDFIVQPIKNFATKENHKRVNHYAAFYENLPINKKTILYESRDGNSMTDSPYAMFRYMVEHPDFKDYIHIWSIADFDSLSSVISKYNGYHNVQFVKRNSKEYLQSLATCEYLINNSTFQSFYTPKKGQIYINTWHGTPLKKMGFEIPGNPSQSQNVLRNFLSTTYLLSPNPHTTKMFTDSYKLKGLYDGTIIEEGYPRIDLTFNTEANLFKQDLKKLGLKIEENKKVILYAPTWKGTNVSKANNDLLQISADLQYLEQKVGSQYSILVKVHPFLYKTAKTYEELQEKLVPDFVDPNELLSTVDVLISDYSSIFFDFLVTDKPILFYTWDADEYAEERGQYLSNEDLPGPLLYNAMELADAVLDIETIQKRYRERYQKMNKDFTLYEDGNVTERVVHYIFKSSNNELNCIKGLALEKKKILIYPGGMRDNGITSSFINLMNNIDFDQYDVSCFTATPKDKEVLKNLAKVNPNVRFLFKPGLPVYKLREVYQDKFIHNRGERGDLGKKLYPEAAYIREHARLFGNSKFDYVIDFSGYSLYWAKFLLAADAKKKICYMHNDLLSDSERKVNGKRPHRINLRGLFSVYHRFDKLVSVSKGTMELNRANLIEYADFNKFDYVMNSIDPSKILQDPIEHMEELDSTNHKVENIKARAILKTIKQHAVLSFLPGNPQTHPVRPIPELEQAEIVVTKKLVTEDSVYYKFTHQNQVIGWIHEEAIELVPDTIISEKNINKIARLVKPDRNHIWSQPYKVADIHKVSSSYPYKNMLFTVDKEAETLHGTYHRISIKDTNIGWIDQSALQFLENCTIDEHISLIERGIRNGKRKAILSKYSRLNQPFLQHLDDRTLKEENFYEEKWARIDFPESYDVWTKAYPNFGGRKISDAMQYANHVVKLLTSHETREGVYYQFSIDNKKIGWLDSKAFTLLEESEKVEIEKVVSNVKEKVLVEPNDKDINFVNMGRLSPEKGQDNLIHAFANFHKRTPNSKLFILGQGPLKEKLQTLINKLELQDAVYLMGQVEKPFGFLKKCDCFVLSSHYEGQPMVLLEAMTLGMKIVATDIVANRTVLENGKYGLLVENSINGIEKGMQNIIQNNESPIGEPFNYQQYNSEAMETFYQVLA